jgi:hypothetical protein
MVELLNGMGRFFFIGSGNLREYGLARSVGKDGRLPDSVKLESSVWVVIPDDAVDLMDFYKIYKRGLTEAVAAGTIIEDIPVGLFHPFP